MGKVGIDESTISSWRERVRRAGEGAEIEPSFEEVELILEDTPEELEAKSRRNKLVYSGLAALVVGAGLMAAAQRRRRGEADAEIVVESSPELMDEKRRRTGNARKR